MYWVKCAFLFEKEIKFLLHWTDALFINYCFLLFTKIWNLRCHKSAWWNIYFLICGKPWWILLSLAHLARGVVGLLVLRGEWCWIIWCWIRVLLFFLLRENVSEGVKEDCLAAMLISMGGSEGRQGDQSLICQLVECL